MSNNGHVIRVINRHEITVIVVSIFRQNENNETNADFDIVRPKTKLL